MYDLIYDPETNQIELSIFNQTPLGSKLLARIGKKQASIKSIHRVTVDTCKQWSISYEADDKAFTGIIKQFPDYIIFEIHYQSSVSKKKRKDVYGNPYISFPSFEGDNWSDHFHSISYKRQHPFNYPLLWQGKITDSIREGKHIPIISCNHNFETLVLSPLSHFLHGTVTITQNPDRIRCGIPRAVKKVAQDMVYSTILVLGSGVNQTIERWGDLLRDTYNVQSIEKDADVLLDKISYWTNAGSSYWYNTIKGQSYEETLKALRQSHDLQRIEFGSYQLDSWWYKKDGSKYTSSIVEWTPAQQVKGKNFNSALHYFAKEQAIPLFNKNELSHIKTLLSKPIGGHFKQISKVSKYVNDRPDDFDIDGFAMPKNYKKAKRVFEEIFNEAADDISYVVHDWISYMSDHHKSFMDMKKADDYFNALDDTLLSGPTNTNKVGHKTLQVCMPKPCITLNSVKMKSVTSIRSTSDSKSFFVEGKKRWWWHIYSSIFINALGKYAYFDTRNYRKYKIWPFFSYPKLEMIMLALSCGPIGFGSKIGSENKKLIQAICKSNGEIIKPDKPSRLLDKCYLINPYHINSEEGPSLYTYTSLGEGFRLYYILSLNLHPLFSKVLINYCLDDITGIEKGDYIFFDYLSEQVQRIKTHDRFSYKLKRRGYKYMIASKISHGFAIIGNLEKFVSGSSQLISKLDLKEDKLVITCYIDKLSDTRWSIYSEKKPWKVTVDDEEVYYSYEDQLLIIHIESNGHESRLSTLRIFV